MELQQFNTEQQFDSHYLVEQINLFRIKEDNRSILIHSDFLKKIEKEFSEEIAEGKISFRLITKELEIGSTRTKVYYLDYEQSLQILMSESKLVRRAVIEVLKKQQEELNKSRTPKTFAEALKLAYEQQLVIEEQSKVISTQKEVILVQKHKALYFDELVERELNVNFRDTAKELGAKQNEFITWLIDNNYIYRDKKNAIKPIARHIDNGLFVIKEWKSDDKEGVQTLVTPKGRQTFLMLFKRK